MLKITTRISNEQMAIITESHPVADGRVRTVTIRTSNQNLMKSLVNRLISLEFSTNTLKAQQLASTQTHDIDNEQSEAPRKRPRKPRRIYRSSRTSLNAITFEPLGEHRCFSGV